MRRSNGYTNIGGVNFNFPSTEWTKVIGISLGESIQNEFARRYWKPIYSFLRLKGYHNEEAKDLTQGFFSEIILDSNLFKSLDRSKGKFRTLLLTALNHYIIDIARHEKRKKRHPGVILHLDDDIEIPDTDITDPEDAFDYGWATDILDAVLSRLKSDCLESGLAVHWELFERRVLCPILEDAPAEPLSQLIKAYDIPSVIKASNMIITVKRRFGQLLRHILQKHVDIDTDIEQEISRLIELLGKGSGLRN